MIQFLVLSLLLVAVMGQKQRLSVAMVVQAAGAVMVLE
jgi:hypothetical protein